MQNDTSRPAVPDGFADGPGLSHLAYDLETLYTSAGPDASLAASLRRLIEARAAAPVPVGAAAGRPVGLLRRRPLVGAAAAAVLALAALGAVFLYGENTQSVSAQEIVERAQSAAQSATTGVRSYHQRATLTQRRSDATITGVIETWYGGTGRFRQERQSRNAAGVASSSGMVMNGNEIWQYTTEGGRTSVERITVDGSAQDLDRKFAPGNGITGLPDLLAQYGDDRGCGTARQHGDGRIAGRSVYVIEVTRTSGCPTRPGPSPIVRSLISVDKQTFFPLKTENYTADGSLVFVHETTSIEYDVTIPAGTFSYTPPPGATVTTPAKPGASQPDTEADCIKQEIAAGRQSTADATCRRSAPSPGSTPSPRP